MEDLAWPHTVREAASLAVANTCAEVLQASGAQVSHLSLLPLASYPEGAFLPDMDRMASLVFAIREPFVGSVIISFPPEQALALIHAYSLHLDNGAPALDCYGMATRQIAEAVVETLGMALSPGESFEETDLISTVIGTHAPADTTVLSMAIEIECAESRCEGAFLLLANAKVLQEKGILIASEASAGAR